MQQQVISLHLPTSGTQSLINFGNSSGQIFRHGNKEDVGVVSYEWLDVVNGSECATQRVVFDETGRNEFIRRAENINQGNCWGVVAHLYADLKTKVRDAATKSYRVKGFASRGWGRS